MYFWNSYLIIQSFMSDSLWPPGLCLCPWDSPGKNTVVGCHFLLQCIKVKSESEVAQSRPTPSGPMDCSQASPSLTSSKFRFLHGWVVLSADCTMYHSVSQWSARKFHHKFLEYTVSPEDWRALSVKTTQLNKTYGEIKAMHEQCSQGKVSGKNILQTNILQDFKISKCGMG